MGSPVPVGVEDGTTELYRAVADEYGEDIDTSRIAGVGAFVVVAGFATAVEGIAGDVTPESVVAAMRSMPEAELPGAGGLRFRCDGEAVPGSPDGLHARVADHDARRRRATHDLRAGRHRIAGGLTPRPRVPSGRAVPLPPPGAPWPGSSSDGSHESRRRPTLTTAHPCVVPVAPADVGGRLPVEHPGAMGPMPGGYVAGETAAFYDVYGEREWQRLEETAYGRLQAHIHAGLLREHIGQGQRVLDAGCGPGRFLIELAHSGARPTAVDTSPGQLRLARERCRDTGVTDAVEAFVRADIVDLAMFADASFDATVCFGGALSYVRDKRRRAVAELLRVTRPGGLLLVSVMSRFGATCNVVRRGHVEVLRDPIAGRVWSVLDDGDLSGFASRAPGWDHPAMHLYSAAELTEHFRGCEIVAVAGSNVTAHEGDPRLDTIAADPDAWATTLEVERRLCCQPGLVDTGSHVILIARRPLD